MALSHSVAITAIAISGGNVIAEEMKKLEKEEALADVAGGGDGWFGHDEAPDGHDIGCWSKMSWYPDADDYCPLLKGFHDYDSGRIELSKNEMKRAITIRYCKCGASREDGLRDRGGDRE